MIVLSGLGSNRLIIQGYGGEGVMIPMAEFSRHTVELTKEMDLESSIEKMVNLDSIIEWEYI